jgi:hypothetical protein
MRFLYACCLKETVAAAVLGCCVAGGMVAVTTGPSTGEGAQPAEFVVNRTYKGDRLSQAARLIQHPNDAWSTRIAPTTPQRTPLGCDPAFSPVANPALAHIFKRCTV